MKYEIPGVGPVSIDVYNLWEKGEKRRILCEPKNKKRHDDTEAAALLKKHKRNNLSEKFESLWMQVRGPDLAKEVMFHPTRKWRIDYYNPYARIGIEIEGLVGGKGKSRHTTLDGYTEDCYKYNAAGMLDGKDGGITILRLTRTMLDYDYIFEVARHIESVATTNHEIKSVGWFYGIKESTQWLKCT